MSETLWHTCAAGHRWREHPDGTVTPPWGLGGTRVTYDQPANRCPAPEYLPVPGDEYEAMMGLVRGVKCSSCGKVDLPWNLYRDLSCSPWEVIAEVERTGHEHEPPVPVCGLPPVKTLSWQQVGQTWVPAAVEPGRQGVLC